MPKKHPKFQRANYGRIKKVSSSWRKPRGIDSKQRAGLKYAGAKPNIGYRNERNARDFHPSGLKEILVSRPGDLKKGFAARIAASVGGRKSESIRKAAVEMGVKILN